MGSHDRVKLPRLHRKGRAYYHVTGRSPRVWTALGSDLSLALREYHRLEGRRIAPAGTVAQVVDAFVESRRGKLAEGSIVQMRAWANHLARVFEDMPPGEIERGDVLAYLDTCPRTSGRAEISLLRQALEREVRAGRLTGNPCVGAKADDPVRSSRKRYIEDGELAAISAAGTPLLRVAIDLAYLTGLRPGDLCRLRWSDFDGGHVHTAKTGARARYTVTDDLRDVLDAARALAPRVATLTVLCERGRPIGRHRLGKLWRAACKVAGIEDAQLRDVRAKTATDADEGGQDAQKLLGHTTAQTTRTYLRGRKIVPVEPLKRRKA